MARITQHVVRHPEGGWSVKKGGADRATRVFKTQEEAIAFGKSMSKKQGAALYIHRRDGMIREKSSYIREPDPPRDQQ